MADNKESQKHPFNAVNFNRFHFGRNNRKVDLTKPCWIGEMQGPGIKSAADIASMKLMQIDSRREGRDKGDSL